MERSSSRKVLLDGKFVAPRSQEQRAVINPANLDVLGYVANCGEEDVHAAVESARAAQRSWWKTPGIEKAALLRQVAARIKQMQEELALLLTKETGKPLWESRDCIDWVVSAFDYYAEVGRRAQGTSFPPSAPHQVNFTVKEPYGVVAAITPFNFPLLLLAWKVAPALAAGNTVVVKPPHQNPLSTLKLAEAFEVLPPGVVNLVTGDGATTGEALIRHRGVDCIAFTGSTNVGRHIASVAGSLLKKVNLELGGIDPFIVFEDADLDVAVRGVAWARLLNAGQVCTSSKRIYVVKDIASEFIRRLVEHVKTLNLGDPISGNTDIGPLISEEAVIKVESQVEKAVAEGATVLFGGKRKTAPSLNGHYFEPTILTNVRHGSTPTTDEIFGPVISVVVAENADDAIAKANDSEYGLGANIYTNNLQYTMKAMENIKAGSFWVNDPLTDNNAAPFGGMRFSGVGRELGEEGLDAFREPKHVHIDYVMERKSYWFPYKDRT